MILNTPIAVSIDAGKTSYSVNLQLSWIENQTPQTSIPNMRQAVTGTPPVFDLFTPAWLDTFDPSSVRNVSLPPIRAISGVVAFGISSANAIPGAFFIQSQSNGYTIAVRAQSVSQLNNSVISFCLPLFVPSNASLTFGQVIGSDGKTVGCANVCLLTYDPVSYFCTQD